MDPQVKKNVRESWLECLYEFASPEMQTLWVTGHPKIIVSFQECICSYFDGLGLEDGLDTAVQEGWLSSDEAEIVAEFHRLADAYEEPPGVAAEVLRDPRWAEVVCAAQEAWNRLSEIITDPAERAWMEELERRWGKNGVSKLRAGIEPHWL